MASGVLTLWVRERWAVAACEGGVLLVALGWGAWNAWAGGEVRLQWGLSLLWAAPALGALQLVAGTSALGWYTAERTVEWLAQGCAVLVLYQAAGDGRFRAGFLKALAVFGGLVGVQAAVQAAGGGGRVYWVFESGFGDRVLGPFVYHNKFAQFAELVAPVLLVVAMREKKWTVAALGGVGVLLAGTVMGGSRAGVVLVVAALVAAAFLEGRWRMAGAAVGLGGVLAGLGGTGLLWSRLAGLNPLEDLRWQLWVSTVEMIWERPLTGWGLGTWAEVYPRFARFDIGLRANQAHCDWLQWAAEGGLVLVGLLAAAVGLMARPLVRSVWGVGVLAVLAHACVDYPFEQAPALAMLVWGAAAVAVAEGETVAGRV